MIKVIFSLVFTILLGASAFAAQDDYCDANTPCACPNGETASCNGGHCTACFAY